MIDFTIVAPCRNAAETLPETLASLLVQTDENWRAFFVDDGSSDETGEILCKAASEDARISVIRTEGVGPSRARNLAVDAARTDWIACLDADDLWPADRLTLARRFLETRPKTDALYGQCGFFVDDPARPTSVSKVAAGRLTVDDVLGENPICTMSNLIIRTDVWRRAGGLDPTMVHAEDLDFLIRLIGGGARIEGLPHGLTLYRSSRNGLSADLDAMARGWRAAASRAAASGWASDRSLARAEARQCRYLARRALRLGAPGRVAAGFALRGAAISPAGFFSDARRGVFTLAAALAAPITPAPLSRALYAR